MDGSVTLELSNHIATVEFYHPKGNSLPGVQLAELSDSIERAGKNSEVRVIILKSKGEGAFCAGASFDELMSIEDYEEGKAFFSGFARVISAMKKASQLIIGRIQGKAVGGGVGLIAACDYAIASEDASVKLSELNLGIGPFVIAPVVERKIGVSALSALTINASDWKDAFWALQKGLYHEVCESGFDLDQTVNQLASKLSESSPEAMEEIKRMLWKGTENLEELMAHRAEVSGRLALSDFTRKFISDFKKRS
jgi:methylglutaconyl-CoA hydratase